MVLPAVDVFSPTGSAMDVDSSSFTFPTENKFGKHFQHFQII
jgi:hypothetical protein